ncbi:hypothetical protein HN51_005612 [Arachis hypogaea]
MASFFIYNQTINFVINSPPPLPRNNNNNDSSINMIHKIYACVFPSLLALLQIQTSSAGSKSPFLLHPLIAEASVLGIFGYYLAFVASLRLARYATQLSVAMAVCGSFSMAWLLALLLPESWWPLRYVFNVMLALLELHQVLVVIYQSPKKPINTSRESNTLDSSPR